MSFHCRTQYDGMLFAVFLIPCSTDSVPVDIQHNQCLRRFLNQREIQVRWSQTSPQRYYVPT